MGGYGVILELVYGGVWSHSGASLWGVGGYGVILELVYAVKGGVTDISIKVTVNNVPILKTLCVKDFVTDLSPKLMAQTDQMIGMAIREGQPYVPYTRKATGTP